MAKFEGHPKMEAEITMRLSESEASALAAIAGYGADGFLKTFYKEMGVAYLKPHEAGLRSLFEAAKRIERIVERANGARAVLEGTMIATYPRRSGGE